MRTVLLFCALLLAGQVCFAQTPVKKKKARPAEPAKFTPPKIVASEEVGAEPAKFTPPKMVANGEGGAEPAQFIPPKMVANEPGGDDLIFSSVETPAEFPGGLDAWRMFLMRNLNMTGVTQKINIPKDQKTWKQTAMARFIVGTNGELEDITIVNEVHPAVAAEAKRVIALSPKWIPAKQNGRQVKAYHQQPIVFMIQ